MSLGPGIEYYAYAGQSFDGCEYTTCPVPAYTSTEYIYNFQTVNTRFDQLTFNLTDGVFGDSLFCAHFPITFLPS